MYFASRTLFRCLYLVTPELYGFVVRLQFYYCHILKVCMGTWMCVGTVCVTQHF